MDKVKQYLNKYKFVLVAVLVLFNLVYAGTKIVKYFMPDAKEANYGDRLDKKPDATSLIATLNTKLKEVTFINNLQVWDQGNIIKIIANVNDDVTVASAKSIGDFLLTCVSESEKAYFDFQLYITKTDPTKTDFPIVGQKHPQKGVFSWPKDRVDS